MSTILFALWMALSAGLLVLFFYAAFVNLRNRRIQHVELGELIPSFLPVNVEALAELADPSRQQRLPQECSAAEREELQRRQIQVTIDCLRRMTHNAALLQKLGYCQLHSPNPLISSLAQEMIDAGVHVRLYTFVGLIALHVRQRFRLKALPFVSIQRLCDVQDLLSQVFQLARGAGAEFVRVLGSSLSVPHHAFDHATGPRPVPAPQPDPFAMVSGGTGCGNGPTGGGGWVVWCCSLR
jgi:hypothetical protein